LFAALMFACEASKPTAHRPPSGTIASTASLAKSASLRSDGKPLVDPRDGKLDIMPLGDSITWGNRGGYRNELYRLLSADGYQVDLVGSLRDPSTVAPDKDHEGHTGFKIHEIRFGVSSWLRAADPDVVLFMIGTNDITWTVPDTVNDIADRLEGLVGEILAFRPGLIVLLATIPPLPPGRVPPMGLERTELNRDYNTQIKTRFAGRERVRLADVHAALSLDDNYDGVHPTQAGQDRIGRVWYETLRPLLPNP